MEELQRKQRIKRLLYSWPSLLFLTFLMVLFAQGAISIFNKERESSNKVLELQASLAQLENREGELKDDIKRLGTPEGVVEEIKEKFSVSQEGEHVAVIVEERVSKATTSTTTVEKLKNWWQKTKKFWRE
jgi:hypothetical protein